MIVINMPAFLFIYIECRCFFLSLCYSFRFSFFSPVRFSRSWQEAQAETPQENDVDTGRHHVRQTLDDGTTGHGDGRRQGAQGPHAGRRLAHHIQIDVAEEVQGWRRRWRRQRRLHKRFDRPGRLVVGQGRSERAPARVRRTVGSRGCGRHVVATTATVVPVVRTTRLPRGRLANADGTYLHRHHYHHHHR